MESFFGASIQGKKAEQIRVEPLVGIEPTTYSLRMNCSTPELQRHLATPKVTMRGPLRKREIGRIVCAGKIYRIEPGV